MKEKWLTTKNLVLMGMFGALAGVLMMFEFPLAFIAPTFYGLDLSEVPVLVGAFSDKIGKRKLLMCMAPMLKTIK